MIFIYLIGIAVVGMSILLIIEHYSSKKPLLQIVKNSCNIDSVHFEGILKKTYITCRESSLSIINPIKKHSQIVVQWSKAQGNSFRSFIRKKLHPTQNKQKSSSFINKMKED